jgi:hypothetical protein
LVSTKPEAEPKTAPTEPTPQKAAEPTEKVKKDLLESLIEHKHKSNGTTEVTRPDSSGDQPNA